MTWGCGLLLLPLLAGLGSVVSALPENLRVEGIDTIYILKWDWDYERHPDATFSVQRSFFNLNNWSSLAGCENITTSECNVTGMETLFRYKFLVSVYNNRTDERYSNIVTFNPLEETVIGPPTNLQMTLQDKHLYITVGAPEGFRDTLLRHHCNWIYHLKGWKNSTHADVITMESNGPSFRINDVETSTSYCVRARAECKESNRTGLYSEVDCIETAPRSYLKEWIIVSVFGGVIVISFLLYICLCPMKRYLKHVFFPKSKLPSSIEKCAHNSPQNYIKDFFLLHDEEKTDKCYIMQNSPADTEPTVDKSTSSSKGQDSGNYSNEDDATGNSTAAIR